MSRSPSPLLAAVLDAVLPGDGGFPSATSVDLAAAMAAHPRFALAADDLLAALDPATDDPVAALTALEAAGDARLAAFLVAAYSLYYTRPGVVAAIERETGYAARPPQPEGYILPAFDPAMLAMPASRPPHYRRAED
jgi:hypothetical protein